MLCKKDICYAGWLNSKEKVICSVVSADEDFATVRLAAGRGSAACRRSSFSLNGERSGKELRWICILLNLSTA